MASSEDPTREANRLYWETDEPVTELADRLGVSRGTLYNHVQPLPAGAECQACGGPLQYPNRSARDSGTAQCAECEEEQQLGPPGDGESEAAGAAGSGGRQTRQRASATAQAADADAALWLGVAGATALVTGALAALLLRR